MTFNPIPPDAPASVKDAFDLTDRVAIITGGAGMLGPRHAAAIAEQGGIPILLDLSHERLVECREWLAQAGHTRCAIHAVDITDEAALQAVLQQTLDAYGRVDILVNNAANNPKMEATPDGGMNWSQFEAYPLAAWHQDIAVGLTGAFLCSRVFGAHMAGVGSGVILNIASDLAVIGPDQRIYRQDGVAADQQPVKPVTYSVVKAGLLGLTRYLATYWADRGLRCNALLPGGVYNDQDPAFVQRLTSLIPMGRMADRDEYKAAIVFLVADASRYMNGSIISIDGGRTAW